MAYRMWRQLLAKEEPSAELSDHMAAQFRTSFPAAVSRFAALADIPCPFVAMQGGQVRYAALSISLRRVGARIAPRSPIPAGSIAYRPREAAISQIDTDEVAQDIWFQDWQKGLDLTELARHYHRFDTSLSLLWFADEDLPEVEVNRFGVRVVDDGGLSELTGQLPWPSGSRPR